ncbi:MAG: alcohol dehydrogenase catalytic domain-containing protein, partial [Armatimonadetes bacterium]|nr:alcohol dehydrogenase catalytic domain-containing protein [Armatimonadota bacterium]
MEAFFITAPGQTGYGQVAEPALQPDEVLLRPRVLGFCGSDLNTWRGRNPLVQYPRIPGHEIGAVIETVGQAVPADLRPGQMVTVSPYSNCGQCPACRQQRPNACRNNQTLGVQRDGALTELLAVPWQRVVPTTKLGLVELALVEPLTIGFHAVARGRVTAGETVAVLGPSGSGKSTLL